MMKARYLLLAASLLAGGVGVAAAQDAASTYDPAQLPSLQGKVAEYSLSPRGDVDGLIMADGTEVHLPPHLSTQLVFAVKPGDSVTIHGLKARAVPMMQAVSVTNDASKVTVVVDEAGFGPRSSHAHFMGHGPGDREHGGPRGEEMGMHGHGPGGHDKLTAQSPVKMALHGPRGDVNGVLLEDGTIVRMPPPEALHLADQLKPGAALYVEGFGVAGPLGKVIMAKAIGPSADKLTQITPPHHGMSGGPDVPPPPGGPDDAPPPPHHGMPRQ